MSRQNVSATPSSNPGSSGKTTAAASAPIALSGTTAAPAASAAPRRALALDALRGIAILGMCLSGVIPWNTLPAWMYHAQTPPPARTFAPDVPGISWVDLVFPYFLFALGAAIPLALSRRLDKARSPWKLVPTIIERTALLLGFAFFYQAIRPWDLNPNPTTLTWIIALLGFGLLFLMFMRFPDSWSEELRDSLRAAGWILAAFFLALYTYPDGSGFSIHRSDIIIVLLAWGYFGGALIWLFTRNKPLVRLGVLVLFFGLRLASTAPGWVKTFWEGSPCPWLFAVGFFGYLCIVVPATLVGDSLLKWMNRKEEDAVPKAAPAEPSLISWTRGRLLAIAGLMMVFQVVLLTGLFGRWVFATTLVAAALGWCGWRLVAHPATATEKWLKQLYLWGFYWLVLGLFLEPYEGGIKKDWATTSYFFTTTGMAIFLLIALIIVIDILRASRGLMWIVQTGQNPMIAYAGIQNLVLAVVFILGINQVAEKLIEGKPWVGFLYGCLLTGLLGAAVSAFTRKKIFWRT